MGLPGQVDIGTAGLGRPPRPLGHAGKTHHEQHPHGTAPFGAGAAQGQGAGVHTRRRIGWIFNLADVVLAPTTALPPPGVHDFDRRGGLATDRAMIRACPVTWPWNLLGWPSINVPAGFTSDGLPIGVQLMGPADEPLLVSLAAELN